MAIDWLEQLEGRVREASERLRELREENGGLRERVRELEQQLALSQERLTAAAEPGGDAGEEWTREREEIRDRIECLARHLEGLLEE